MGRENQDYPLERGAHFCEDELRAVHWSGLRAARGAAQPRPEGLPLRPERGLPIALREPRHIHGLTHEDAERHGDPVPTAGQTPSALKNRQ